MLACYAAYLAASPRLRDALTPHERLETKQAGPLAGKCKALQEGITDEWCETNYAGFPKFCQCEGVVAVDPADAAKAVAKAAAEANAQAAIPAEGQPLPDTPPQGQPATVPTESAQQPAPEAPVSAQQPAPEAPASVQQPAPVAPEPVPVPVAAAQAAPVAEPAAAAVPEVTIGSNDATAGLPEASNMCGSPEMDEYFNKKCGNSVASIIAECCDEHMDDAKCDSFRMACIKGHIEAGECEDPFDCDDGCQFYDGVASTCCPHVRARRLAAAPSKQVDWATGAELPLAPAAQYDAPLDEAAMKESIAAAVAADVAAAQAEAQAAPDAFDPAAAAKAAAHDAAQANAQATAQAKGAHAQAKEAEAAAAGVDGAAAAAAAGPAVDWATGAELPQAPAAQYEAPLDEAAMRDSIAAAEAEIAANAPTPTKSVPQAQQERAEDDDPYGRGTIQPQEKEDPDAEFNPNNPKSDGAPHQRPAPTQTPDDYCGSPAHAAHFDELCGGKLLDIMADCCTQECIYHWKCAKKCDKHRASCSQAQVTMGVCTDTNDCDMGTQVFNQVTDSCCTRAPPPVPPPSAPPPYRVCERHDRRKGERNHLEAEPLH